MAIYPIVVEIFKPGQKWWTGQLTDRNCYPQSHNIKWDMSKNKPLYIFFNVSPFFSLFCCLFPSFSLCLPSLPVDYSIHPSTMPFAVWQCSFSTRTANGFVNMSCMVIYSHHSSRKKNSDDWWPIDFEQKNDDSSDESPEEGCFVK